jgi:hypothetical protein
MNNLRLAAVVGLAVLATVCAVEWLKTGLQPPETRSQKERESAQEYADLMAAEPEAEQIQPPNPSWNEKAAASTQPLNSPVRSARP